MLPLNEGDDGEIGRRILMAWAENMSLTEIASELKLDLGFVFRVLKQEQKKRTAQDGEE